MKTSGLKKTGLLLVLLIAIGAGVWLWKSRQGGSVAPAPGAQATADRSKAGAGLPSASQPIEFSAGDLQVLAPGTLARSIPLTGSLRAVDQTVVRTRVAGELRELSVREGMNVLKGQRIGRVDPAEFELRVSERQAQLAAAESQVAQARRTFDNNLALRERNFISQSALDASRSNLEVAIGQRDAARAQLDLGRKSVADADLIAPMSGVIGERFAQPGEKLPSDAKVVSVIDLSRLEIEAAVPGSDIGAMKVGQTVKLRIEGVQGEQTGQIARIAPATSPGTRSVPVYISLKSTDPAIRVGLFAQGRLVVETLPDVIAVPLGAILDSGARNFVYAIEQDRLVEKDITLGLVDDGADGTVRVQVLSGLSPGDRIVVNKLGRLRTGSPVRVRTGDR
ncbi:MAG: efflux RND transporter periplasmic adaptor subunit [Burkholderiaceae bacterium]